MFDFHVFQVMSSTQMVMFQQTTTLTYRTDVNTADQCTKLNFHCTPVNAIWHESYCQNTINIHSNLNSTYYMLGFKLEKETFYRRYFEQRQQIAHRRGDTSVMIDGSYKLQELELQTLILFKFDLDFSMFAGENFQRQRGHLRSWGRVYDVHFNVPKTWLYDTLEQQTYQVFYWVKNKLDADYTPEKLAQLRARAGLFGPLAKEQTTYEVQTAISSELFKIGKAYFDLKHLTAHAFNGEIVTPQCVEALRAQAKGRALLEFMRAEQAALQSSASK